MASFDRWLSTFATCVGRVRDREAGRPTLLFVSEYDEDALHAWWQEGVRPKIAAQRFLAGEARPCK